MRNVIIVVAVFTTNCHVSLNPKNGPEMAHVAIMRTAIEATTGRPAKRAAMRANWEYHLLPPSMYSVLCAFYLARASGRGPAAFALDFRLHQFVLSLRHALTEIVQIQV